MNKGGIEISGGADQSGVKQFLGVDFDFGALRNAGPRYWRFVALLATFVGLGAVSWLVYITQGGAVMGMRDYIPWGLWFTNYMYYIGLSAGGLVVYASVHLFGAHQFAPLSRLAVLQAGVLVMLALLGILSDMEMPWRAVSFILTPNPTAPFVYTGSAAGIYMVICFVDLWVLITGKGGEKFAHTMTLIALPFAIYLHTTTAFVLAMNKSIELWHSAVMVPIFLTSATASGIALLICFAYIVQKFGGMRFKPSMFRSLSTLLATVMIIDLFLLVVEILHVLWKTSAKPGHVIRMMEFLTGRYALAFLPVLVLGIAAFALLSRRSTRHIPAVQITASLMYVVAIYFKRYSLMSMGVSISAMGQVSPIYLPSLVEVLLAVGILSFGLLFVTVAFKVLPMRVPEHEHDNVEAIALVEAHEAPHPTAQPTPQPAFESGVNSL